ncbi:MAG: hypothetical protein B6U78_01805 [Candidatus Aenigmarchaeota archaeon ex4484_224]|nr:MAG: hypothetical protein B6U78_01805 [Candidatus Aenigmarchaeota archaeon ex4484_224]
MKLLSLIILLSIFLITILSISHLFKSFTGKFYSIKNFEWKRIGKIEIKSGKIAQVRKNLNFK